MGAIEQLRRSIPKQESTSLLGAYSQETLTQHDQATRIEFKQRWHNTKTTDTLNSELMVIQGFMSDTDTATTEPAAVESPDPSASTDNQEEGINFSERYSEVLGKVNEALNKVDWGQMGRIGKVVGILAAVIVVQVLIKGILDTINLLPVIPGLLELLGVVVVGHWSWKNLTTSEKRTELTNRVQSLRKEYLG